MLPDLSVLWVIFFVLLLTVILDRLLFKPILRVIAERRPEPSLGLEEVEARLNADGFIES